jgi:hypothetical protein
MNLTIGVQLSCSIYDSLVELWHASWMEDGTQQCEYDTERRSENKDICIK